MRCSFCDKGRNSVGKLISNPGSNGPRVYICQKCIAVAAFIVEDDEIEAEIAQAETMPEAEPHHPFLGHPLASDLMGAIELWVRAESSSKDSLAAMEKARALATFISATTGDSPASGTR